MSKLGATAKLFQKLIDNSRIEQDFEVASSLCAFENSTKDLACAFLHTFGLWSGTGYQFIELHSAKRRDSRRIVPGLAKEREVTPGVSPPPSGVGPHLHGRTTDVTRISKRREAAKAHLLLCLNGLIHSQHFNIVT